MLADTVPAVVEAPSPSFDSISALGLGSMASDRHGEQRQRERQEQQRQLDCGQVVVCSDMFSDITVLRVKPVPPSSVSTTFAVDRGSSGSGGSGGICTEGNSKYLLAYFI